MNHLSLQERLSADLKEAMKSGDKIRVSTLRLIRSEIKYAEIAAGKPLDESGAGEVLSREAKKHRESITEFKKALRYQPSNSDIWSNLAIAYENLGKSEDAIGALYKAVQYNPGNITARINLAAMYHNANHFKKAIAQYKQVVSMDGSNEEALTNLAKCLVSVGKYAEAKNYLMQAIASNPNNAL